MAEDITRTPDLAIPMSRRGPGHMAGVLRGTRADAVGDGGALPSNGVPHGQIKACMLKK